MIDHESSGIPNPFHLPGRMPGDFGALCPWSQLAHADLYVPIDHTNEAFTTFQQAITGSGSAGRPRVILIHGGEGCGKTALMHRCAHLLVTACNASSPCYVLDLTPDKLAGVDSASQLRHLSARVVDQLRLRRVFEPRLDKTLPIGVVRRSNSSPS